MQSNTLLLVSNLAVIASVWLLVAHEFSRSTQTALTPTDLPEKADGNGLHLVPNKLGQLQDILCAGGLHYGDNPDVARLQAELTDLSKFFKSTRKELGKMKCEKAAASGGGVGDSGGFCLWGVKSKFTGVGGNDLLDTPMAKAFEQFLAGKSMYDFGCGVGRYGAFWLHGEGVPPSYPWKSDFNQTGPKLIKSWAGFDGSEGVEEVTDGFVQFMDLSIPSYLPPADWVVGLEVGEHVPKEFQDTLLANFDRHNKEGIILSWAVRGQGGHHHVNNMNNDEVVAIVERLGPTGYTYDRAQSEAFKKVAALPWFQNTVMVFRKNGAKV